MFIHFKWKGRFKLGWVEGNIWGGIYVFVKNHSIQFHFLWWDAVWIPPTHPSRPNTRLPTSVTWSTSRRRALIERFTYFQYNCKNNKEEKVYLHNIKLLDLCYQVRTTRISLFIWLYFAGLPQMLSIWPPFLNKDKWVQHLCIQEASATNWIDKMFWKLDQSNNFLNWIRRAFFLNTSNARCSCHVQTLSYIR